MIRYNLSSPRSKFEMLLNEACISNAGRSLKNIWKISDIGEQSARGVMDSLFQKFGSTAIDNKDIERSREALGGAIMELTQIAAANVGTDRLRN
jgi:hypothetical protein